ncbi:MAG: galactose mutarotase [Lachnospiraceae bacterium]|nr:galactose mutarotase [Lachnospiraceae bacterium]MBO7339193.1 galactose mutarotase [Lachnospiraceae bacterium]MBP5732610.1 galactose mutarotase [Lachnospiraceae bacterium]MBR3470530.1 galactose mutarotase [Lachnospiraceae bacterium]
MAVEIQDFGKAKDGREIKLYTIKNKKGMQAAVTNIGAILVKLLVPDEKGTLDDLVLGFDHGEDYYQNGCFFGAVIGPNANRIGGASFEIDGVKYQLAVNDGPNNLHSDFEKGYHKAIWDAEVFENGVRFSLEDTDGNMGFPGNKKIQVTYTLDENNGLELHYHASSDKKTVLNLTNHTYFNLDGHDAGSIEGHELWLNCSKYTPVVKGAIPTGEQAPVAGTFMDFTQPKVIGKEINEKWEQLLLTGGYDHNWIIDGADGKLREIATVKGPKSGRVMKVYTTLPGVQFYAGNFIAPQTGKDGVNYGRRGGLCLETQYYPDTVHQPDFPSCIFGGEKEYDSVTVYRF